MRSMNIRNIKPLGVIGLLTLCIFLLSLNQSAHTDSGGTESGGPACEKVRNKKDGFNFDTDMSIKRKDLTDLTYGDSMKFPSKFVYRPYLNCLDQKDPALIEIIREKYLHSPNLKPYDLPDPFNITAHPVEELDFADQSKDIIDLIYKKRGVPKRGFFIESGSVDGASMSVSLEFELRYGWTGLLVEANPLDFLLGMETNRKAFQLNTCLGVQQTPHYSMFDFTAAVRTDHHYSMGGLTDNVGSNSVQMQCLPFFSILMAAGNPTVNLLILDIEGAELAVLRTVPWNKIDIEVMMVETDLIGRSIPGGSQDEIRQYIESQGYSRFASRDAINDMTGLYQNDIFVRKDIVRKYDVTGY